MIGEQKILSYNYLACLGSRHSAEPRVARFALWAG